MDWLTFLKDVIATQQFLQIFVGGCTMMLIGWIVTRARGDREHLPPPAPIGIADVPMPFMQGPRESSANASARGLEPPTQPLRVVTRPSNRAPEFFDPAWLADLPREAIDFSFPGS